MVDRDDEGYEEDEGCGPCARGGGLLLLAVGIGLSLIGADLLTGGAVTRLITGGAAAGIAASAVLEDDDDEGQADADEDLEGAAAAAGAE